MARTVDLDELRTSARHLSDTENDANITDAELTILANRHLCEVWDQLVDAGPADFYAATTTVTTAHSQVTYALPSNFRNLTDVFVHESSIDRRPLRDMGNGSRGYYRPPTGVYTVTLEYIPTAPVLSAGSDTFDGVSGWEALIVEMMARDVMKKRDAYDGRFDGTIGALQARIRSRARSRDKGRPKRVTDLDEVFTTSWPFAREYASALSVYRLRAGNIELYETLGGRL